MPKFYGQFGEDIYIYNKFINIENPYGTYVELGAINGVTYSITKFFEDNLDFKGILIEPTIQYTELLKNRPHNNCFNYAINSSNTETMFYGDNATAGLLEYINDNTKKSLDINTKIYKVDSRPFREIQNITKIPFIDIFVLDVEGAEEMVLKTIDFTVPIYIMVIELDGFNPQKDENCREILRSNGFTLDIRININEFWVNKSYFRHDKLFDKNKRKYKLEDEDCEFPYLDFGHEQIVDLRNKINGRD